MDVPTWGEALIRKVKEEEARSRKRTNRWLAAILLGLTVAASWLLFPRPPPPPPPPLDMNGFIATAAEARAGDDTALAAYLNTSSPDELMMTARSAAKAHAPLAIRLAASHGGACASASNDAMVALLGAHGRSFGGDSKSNQPVADVKRESWYRSVLYSGGQAGAEAPCKGSCAAKLRALLAQAGLTTDGAVRTVPTRARRRLAPRANTRTSPGAPPSRDTSSSPDPPPRTTAAAADRRGRPALRSF